MYYFHKAVYYCWSDRRKSRQRRLPIESAPTCASCENGTLYIFPIHATCIFGNCPPDINVI